MFAVPESDVNQSIIILTWTPFFSSDLAEWIYEAGLSDFVVQTKDPHMYLENLTAASFRSLSKARAVLFHIRDMKSTDLPMSRSPENLFTFFLAESPPHTGDILQHIPSDYFNLTMTYRYGVKILLDSDIRALYGNMIPIDNFTSSEEMWRWEEVERIVGNKTKSALLFVSNCVTESKREVYARELSRYTEVSEFGLCAKRECDEQCAEQEIGYLLPNGSFIAADDFDSPASLAAYMKHLESNKKAYLRLYYKLANICFTFRYFEWTKVYKKKTKINYACDLCTLLHTDSKKPRVIDDIKSWWIDKGSCINDYATSLLTH
uniref:Fucosyltransferase n=1 Tax=Parascaris equorum TaxID=6256 RepID=A0A914RSL3_PAREQ